MRYLNTQTLVGLFGLVTVILVGTAVGRLVGLGVWEAVYMTTLLAALMGSAAYRLSGRVKKD